jgi:UDP-2-acetamido-2-deoxy-ribo-hexuluronate aminotransferase
MYNEQLSNSSAPSSFTLPQVKADRTSVYAQYTLRVKDRESVQASLKEQGIPTAVHYPMPLHLQECFDYLGQSKGCFPEAEKASVEVMSLPMNAFLGARGLSYIVSNFNNLYS